MAGKKKANLQNFQAPTNLILCKDSTSSHHGLRAAALAAIYDTFRLLVLSRKDLGTLAYDLPDAELAGRASRGGGKGGTVHAAGIMMISTTQHSGRRSFPVSTLRKHDLDPKLMLRDQACHLL